MDRSAHESATTQPHGQRSTGPRLGQRTGAAAVTEGAASRTLGSVMGGKLPQPAEIATEWRKRERPPRRWDPRGACTGPSRGRPRRGGQGRRCGAFRSATRFTREAACRGERVLRTPCAPSRCKKDPSTRQPSRTGADGLRARKFARRPGCTTSSYISVGCVGVLSRHPIEGRHNVRLPFLFGRCMHRLLATSCGVSPVAWQVLRSCRLEFLARTRLVTRGVRAVQPLRGRDARSSFVRLRVSNHPVSRWSERQQPVPSSLRGGRAGGRAGGRSEQFGARGLPARPPRGLPRIRQLQPMLLPQFRQR
jgi:hypothetical protein